jgi:hypothetical protein
LCGLRVVAAAAAAAAGADQSAGGALGHENSVGVGLAEQQLNSAMQQLGMSEGGFRCFAVDGCSDASHPAQVCMHNTHSTADTYCIHPVD